MGYYEAVSGSAPVLWWRLHAYGDASEVIDAAGAHRYWRMYVLSNNNGGAGTYTGLAELQFLDATGSGMLNSTSSIASSSQYSTNPGTNLIDGNTSTWWASATAASGVGSWISWDMGVGLSGTVYNVVITSRPDGVPAQAPYQIQVQWSDDNTNWTGAYQLNYLTWVGSSQVQTGSLTTIIANRGTGGYTLSGTFSVATSSNFGIFTAAAESASLTGSAAFNPFLSASASATAAAAMSNSLGMYLTTTGQQIYTERTHAFDFFNMFDPAQTGSEWTVEFWVRVRQAAAAPATFWSWGGNDTNTEGIFFTLGGGQGSGLSGYSATTDMRMSINYYSGSTYVRYWDWLGGGFQSFGFNDDQWHHVVVACQNRPYNQNMSMYVMVNGHMQTAGNISSNWPSTTPSQPGWFRNYSGGMRFNIGNNYNQSYGGYTNPNSLYMSEVAVYDRALMPSESLAHFHAANFDLGERLGATGTIYAPLPIYTIQVTPRNTVVPVTSSGGGRDARASKANPGTN